MRRTAFLAALLAAAVAAGTTSFSGATFASSSRNAGNRAGAAYDWTSPDVALVDPGPVLLGSAVLTATASDARTAVAEVSIAYAPAGTGAWTPICSATAAPYACTLDTALLPDGRYDLRATAVDVKGNTGTSAVLTGRAVDHVAPTVVLQELPPAVRGTVTLSATGADAVSGVASLRIQRAPAGTATWTDVCTVASMTASCSLSTTSLPNDYLDLRAIATDRAGNVSAPAVQEDVLVDNLAPTVTMTNPGSPIRGTVTLGASPADAHSGVASVTVQVAPTGTTTWKTACTATVSPWTCRFDTTTLADGGYDFRAIAADLVGNTATSATVTNRVVDNAQSSISLEDPGAFLTGIVQLQANPYSRAGITSVRIQRAPAGGSTWTDICTATLSPHTCAWDTRTVSDGLYDLRAILVDGNGKTTTSAVVAGRRVDNTPLRGTDVQSTNGGGTVGKVEVNDTLSLTYSERLRPESLVSGWDGTSRTVAIRIRDGGLVGLQNIDDQLDVWTSTSLGTAVNLGTVNLRGDFVKGGKTAVFNATLALQTVTVGGVEVSRAVITVGALASGSVRTSGSTSHMVWTPSSAARDLAGNACSTSPVTETGTLDKDF